MAPNLLTRDFTAHRPDHKWLAYITCIPTGEEWLYLAAILDLFTRRIVGWAMSHRMTSELTLAALKMAIGRRQPEEDLTHHSDQGSQYTDGTYQALLGARLSDRYEWGGSMVRQCTHGELLRHIQKPVGEPSCVPHSR